MQECLRNGKHIRVRVRGTGKESTKGKTAGYFVGEMSAMRARGCATGLATMSISQRRNSKSTHQATLALTPRLHNKAVPIFIELPLCRTGTGAYPPLAVSTSDSPGILIAAPRDSAR